MTTRDAVQGVPITRAEARVDRVVISRLPKMIIRWNGFDGNLVDQVRVAQLGVEVRADREEDVMRIDSARRARVHASGGWCRVDD